MSTDQDIHDFLAGYGDDVGQVALALRKTVLALVSDNHETLHAGWKVISYGGKRRVCAIAPHKNWVNLQFGAGTLLPDPDGRLEGTGKSMRHVKIRSAGDIDAAVKDLIAAANKLNS